MKTTSKFLMSLAASVLLGHAAAATTGGSFVCGVGDGRFGPVSCGVSSVDGPTTNFLGNYTGEFNGSPAAGSGVSGFYRAEYGNVGTSLHANAYAYDQFYAYARPRVTAGYNDEWTISSTTLAIGTPVYVDVRFVLTATFDSFTFLTDPTSIATFSRSFAVNFYFNSPSAGLIQFTGESWVPGETSLNVDRNATFAARVGETVSISYVMESALNLDVSQPSVNLPSATTIIASSRSENSGHIYISASQNDFNISSASGHLYAIAVVPEPDTVALVLVGLSIIGAKLKLVPNNKRLSGRA